MKFAYAFSLWRNHLKEPENKIMGIKLKQVYSRIPHPFQVKELQPCLPSAATLQCHPLVRVLLECDLCSTSPFGVLSKTRIKQFQ